MIKINTIKCEALGKYISCIHRSGNIFLSKKLNQYGVGYGQYLFLLYLYNSDGLNQEELSEILNIDKGTTARAIKKLEEHELIIRVKDKNDKRAYKVYVTDKGKSIKEGIYQVLREWEEILTSNLTMEEKNQILNILKKISINHCNI